MSAGKSADLGPAPMDLVLPGGSVANIGSIGQSAAGGGTSPKARAEARASSGSSSKRPAAPAAGSLAVAVAMSVSSSSSSPSSSSSSSSSSSTSSLISVSRLTSTEEEYSPEESSDTFLPRAPSLSSSSESRPSIPMRGAEEMAALRAVYYGLGPEKWREAIDGSEAKYGKMVYDECLHRGNDGRKETGFLSSILAGMDFISENLGRKTTPEMWLQAHAIACRHFLSRKKTGTDGTKIGGRVRTRFREPVGGMTNAPHMVSNEARREVSRSRPQVSRLRHVRLKGSARKTEDGSSYYSLTLSSLVTTDSANEGYKLYFLPMKRKRRMAYFERAIDEFYAEMRKALTADAKLTGIVRLHQFMQRLHVARDGTQRTSVLFLNKHLTEYGFTPTILHEPHKADIVSNAEFVLLVRQGMRTWAKHRPADAAAGSGARPMIITSASDGSVPRFDL